jgi:TetR/AcrR family transcriptional regulator, cholesterol catabolism regulator
VPSSDRVKTPTASGRRERKKLATRDRIFECGVSLFASRGYDSTTMEDIAECADVARATVFNYFARKEDVVFEWFVRLRPQLAEIIEETRQQTTDTPSQLRRFVGGLARLYEDDPATGRAMVRAWLRAGGPLLDYTFETPALLADTIRSGQEQGNIAPDLDATRAGLVLYDAYLGVFYRWVRDTDLPLEENLMATLDLVLTGIACGDFGRTHPKRRSKKTSGN